LAESFLGIGFVARWRYSLLNLSFGIADPTNQTAPLGFEYYVRRKSLSLELENNAKTPKNSLVDYDFRMIGDLHVGRYRIDPGEEVHLNKVDANDTSGFEGKGQDDREESKKLNERLRELQEMLYAEHKMKVLVLGRYA